MLPPALIIKEAGPGFWLSCLMGNVLGNLVVIIILLLAKKFPGKDPIEISESIFGKVGRIAFGLLFTFLFLEIHFLALRELGEFIKPLLLPRTPLFFVLLSTILVSVYAVNSGLEIIGRMADFIMPIVFFSLIIILLIISRSAQWNFFTPILDHGWEGIIRGANAPALWCSEIFLGAFFLPYIKQQNKQALCLFTPLFLEGIISFITLAFTIGVLGVEMAGRLKFPVFNASSMGRATLLQQMDIFMAAIWILGVSLKIYIYHYVTALSLQKTFNSQSYKPFVLPLALLAGLFSYTLFNSDIDLIEFFKKAGVNILFFTFMLPLLLLLSSFIRKVKR